jgi:endonuclease IV
MFREIKAVIPFADVVLDVRTRSIIVEANQPISQDTRKMVEQFYAEDSVRVIFHAPYPVKPVSKKNLRARVLAGVG